MRLFTSPCSRRLKAGRPSTVESFIGRNVRSGETDEGRSDDRDARKWRSRRHEADVRLGSEYTVPRRATDGELAPNADIFAPICARSNAPRIERVAALFHSKVLHSSQLSGPWSLTARWDNHFASLIAGGGVRAPRS